MFVLFLVYGSCLVRSLFSLHELPVSSWHSNTVWAAPVLRGMGKDSMDERDCNVILFLVSL